MAERRREGARLLRRTKLKKAAIARRLSVSRAAVGQWAKDLAAGGLRQLDQRRSTGRPGKLSDEQMDHLDQILQRGALAAGFPTARWTSARVKQVIEREFAVTYHISYLPRLLERLGWSLQQPLARAVERDEEVIQAWLAHAWPRIRKGAATWRRHRVLR
ncbi:MAG: winged helix-turn-helix domain-containing protein [Chloroflexi bacterium]|nr:winged helix-turn-helix domain-containing protein [Chloroflexota bacterium]